MKRYVLDTGIASDLINRRGPVFRIAREKTANGTTLGIAYPGLGELFAGVENSQTRDLNYGKLVRNLGRFKL